MKTVTVQMLIGLKACAPMVKVFQEAFPSGEAEVTPANCRKVAQLLGPHSWAARNLLKRKDYYIYEE